MSETFDPSARGVLVPVLVVGPTRAHRFQLLLDTSAGMTTLRAEFLRLLGYRPEDSTDRRRLRSATGTAIAPVVRLRSITGLAVTHTDFPAAAYDPPPAVTADGLLGLDFLRGRVLTLDFARGRVGLRTPRKWWPWG